MAKGIADYVIGLLVVIVFSAAVVYVFDIPATPERFLIFIGALGALTLFARSTADYAVGFIIVTLGILSIIVGYFFPDWLIRPFEGLALFVNGVMGFDVWRHIDPLNFFVLSIAFTTAVIMIRIRLTPGDRRYIDTIVDKTLSRYALWVDRYFSIGRLIVLFLLGIGVILLEQTAQLTGTLGDIVAQAPFFVSNVFAAVAGFLSLGGELPIIGSIPLIDSLTATEYAIIAVAVLFLAASAAYSGSGPLANFLRR